MVQVCATSVMATLLPQLSDAICCCANFGPAEYYTTASSFCNCCTCIIADTGQTREAGIASTTGLQLQPLCPMLCLCMYNHKEFTHAAVLLTVNESKASCTNLAVQIRYWDHAVLKRSLERQMATKLIGCRVCLLVC